MPLVYPLLGICLRRGRIDAGRAPQPQFGSVGAAAVAAAHARGMKVYLDIVINHTADVIRYRECPANDCSYRWARDYPVQRRGGLSGAPMVR